MQATLGWRDAAQARSEIRSHFGLKLCDNFFPAFRDAAGGRDAPDVIPNIGQRVWLQRHQLRTAGHPARQRAFHVLQADGADPALRLRDNMSRLQRVQHLARHFVNRKRTRDPLLDALVDFGARSIGGKGRRGANRQRQDLRREIAFVRAAHLIAAETQGRNNLAGAGDQRHDPEHASTLALRQR